MIDIHSHLLPAIDDGSPNVETSLAMARMAVADGVQHMVCTPHVVPGLYDNSLEGITNAVMLLQHELQHYGIPLRLYVGADVHIAPNLELSLGKSVPTIAGTRYFLFEPPHHVMPPRIVETIKQLVSSNFVPVLTHPERLSWVHQNYDVVEQMNAAGCLIQITAGALTGGFGQRSQKLALRFLEDRRVDVIASDTHDPKHRPPILSEAATVVQERLGEEEAQRMIFDCPLAILRNEVLQPVGANLGARKKLGKKSFWSRFTGKKPRTDTSVQGGEL